MLSLQAVAPQAPATPAEPGGTSASNASGFDFLAFMLATASSVSPAGDLSNEAEPAGEGDAQAKDSGHEKADPDPSALNGGAPGTGTDCGSLLLQAMIAGLARSAAIPANGSQGAAGAPVADRTGTGPTPEEAAATKATNGSGQLADGSGETESPFPVSSMPGSGQPGHSRTSAVGRSAVKGAGKGGSKAGDQQAASAEGVVNLNPAVLPVPGTTPVKTVATSAPAVNQTGIETAQKPRQAAPGGGPVQGVRAAKTGLENAPETARSGMVRESANAAAGQGKDVQAAGTETGVRAGEVAFALRLAPSAEAHSPASTPAGRDGKTAPPSTIQAAGPATEDPTAGTLAGENRQDQGQHEKPEQDSRRTDGQRDPDGRSETQAPFVSQHDAPNQMAFDRSSPAAPHPAAAADSRATHQTSPAAPVAAPDLPVNPSKAAAPLRELEVKLPGSQQDSVGLHIVEDQGKVHVEVRTTDPQLAASLRDNVGDLVQKLDRSGYRTESLQAHDASPAGVASQGSNFSDSDHGRGSAEDQGQSSGQGGGGQAGQQQQGQGNGQGRNRPRWLEEIVNSFHSGEQKVGRED